MSKYFELGRILKPQGIKGEIKMTAYTDNMERFDELEYVFFKKNEKYERAEVLSARSDTKHAYLLIEGIDDRNVAEQLRGSTVYIDREQAVELPKGHFYIQDLLGITVQTDAKGTIGTLEDILQTGRHDVYAVRLIEGGTLMFPVIKDVVVTCNIKENVMVLSDAKLDEVAIYDI